MTQSQTSRLPSWLVGSGVIAIAMGVMNVATYAFTILAARWLGPQQYGALAALMGLLLIVTVVALGLQAECDHGDDEQQAHQRREGAVLLWAEPPGGQDRERVRRHVHHAHRDRDHATSHQP